MDIRKIIKEVLNESAWDDFHSGEHGRTDLIYNRSADTSLDGLTRHLSPGDNVLDIASGDGVDSIYLSDKGYNVTGLDISNYVITKSI